MNISNHELIVASGLTTERTEKEVAFATMENGVVTIVKENGYTLVSFRLEDLYKAVGIEERKSYRKKR